MVINEKSQDSVASCLRYNGSFDYFVITNLLLNFLLRNFKYLSTFGKVIGKKGDCLMRHVRCGTVQLKIRYISGRNCHNRIALRQRASLTMSGIDKYQTGVLLTTFDSLTAAISDRLNVDRVCRRFVATSFFFVACRRIQSVMLQFLAWPL